MDHSFPQGSTVPSTLPKGHTASYTGHHFLACNVSPSPTPYSGSNQSLQLYSLPLSHADPTSTLWLFQIKLLSVIQMCPFFLPPSFGSCYELCSAWNTLLPSIGHQILPVCLLHATLSMKSFLDPHIWGNYSQIHPHGVCFGQDSVGCKWQNLSSKWLQQNKEFIGSRNWKLQAWLDLSVWTTSSGVSQFLFWVGCILR